MELGKGSDHCQRQVEILKQNEDDEKKKTQESLKIASFKDISRVKIFREGYVFLQKCFQSPDNEKLLNVMEEPNKNNVRHSLIFQRLATGEEQLKSFSSGYLDQCETQLRDVCLRTLLSIRITQPDFINVPDSLQRHARFTETIDQILAEKIADYLLNVTCYQNRSTKCSDKPLCELFDINQEKQTLGLASRRNYLLNIRKKKLGYEVMFILGITSLLSKFSEQHVRATLSLLVSENIQFHTTWWRFVLPVSSSISQNKPRCEEFQLPTSPKKNFLYCNSNLFVNNHFKKTQNNFKTVSTETVNICNPSSTGNSSEKITQPDTLSLLHSSSEKMFGKTTSFIYKESKCHITNHMVAHGGRLAMQRSRSVDAVNRQLLKGGTQLINLFVKIPEFYLTTHRPLTSDIFLCQNTNWVECQTIGRVITASLDSCLRNPTHFGTLYVFKLAPTASLDRFIRPMDAAQALRQELQGVVLSRNETCHSSNHFQDHTNTISSMLKACSKKTTLSPSDLENVCKKNKSPTRSVNTTIQLESEKSKITEHNSMITLDNVCKPESEIKYGFSDDRSSSLQRVGCKAEEKGYSKQRASALNSSICFGVEKSLHQKNGSVKDPPTYLRMDLLSNDFRQKQNKLSNVLRRSHEFSPLGYLYKYETQNQNGFFLKKLNSANIKNVKDICNSKKKLNPHCTTTESLTPKTTRKKVADIQNQEKISTRLTILKNEKDIHGSSERRLFSFLKPIETKESFMTRLPEIKERTFKKVPSLCYKNILSQDMLSNSIHFLAEKQGHMTLKNKSCESSSFLTQKSTKKNTDEENGIKKNRMKDKFIKEGHTKPEIMLHRIKKLEEMCPTGDLSKKDVRVEQRQAPCNLQVFSLRQLTESHYLPKSLSKQDRLLHVNGGNNETLYHTQSDYSSKLKLPRIRRTTKTLSSENSVTSLPTSTKLSESVQRRIFNCNNLRLGEQKTYVHLKAKPVTFMSKISQFPKSSIKTAMCANRVEEMQSIKDKDSFILKKTINRMRVMTIPVNADFGVSLQKTPSLNDRQHSSTESRLPVIQRQSPPSSFHSFSNSTVKKAVDSNDNQLLSLIKKKSFEKSLESPCVTSQLTPSRWDYWRSHSNSVLGILLDKTFENKKID